MVRVYHGSFRGDVAERFRTAIFYKSAGTITGDHGEVDTIQPALTCSKLTIETLEQGVGYVQSKQ